jgi:hypothetical protein
MPASRGRRDDNGHRSWRRCARSRQTVLLSAWVLSHRSCPMTNNLAELSKNKIARLYAVGIVGFSAFFGFLTVLAVFLAHLK